MDRNAESGYWKFCFEALPKVSRTFALSISKLKEPLRSQVCVSYLICRILDTVEDAPFLDTEMRREMIFPFLDNLEKGSLPGESLPGAFRALIEKGASENDFELLTRADDVARAFASLEPAARKAIFPWVKEMGEGMVIYSRKMGTGIKTIVNLEDLDQYCYYIAGTVGYMLTELFSLNSEYIDGKLASALKKNANDFGLGLQKVNILKDVRDDYSRGWCFVPSGLLGKSGLAQKDLEDERNSGPVFEALRPLLEGLKGNLERAFEYLSMIPVQERETRLFLATSLFFAGETMSLIVRRRKYFLSSEKLKISRLKVAEVLLKLESSAGDNAALERLWERTKSDFEGYLR